MSESPFGFEKPQDSPGFLLWQTTITWERLIKKGLEAHGVSHSQFVIMAILLWFEERNYDKTQALIVKWTRLDKMTVSKALKNLGSRGLVTRTEHSVDTRSKSVSLTIEGKALVHRLIPIVEKSDAAFFGTLQPQDQQTLIQILSKLTAGTDA